MRYALINTQVLDRTVNIYVMNAEDEVLQGLEEVVPARQYTTQVRLLAAPRGACYVPCLRHSY